jgi:hypothetical protein
MGKKKRKGLRENAKRWKEWYGAQNPQREVCKAFVAGQIYKTGETRLWPIDSRKIHRKPALQVAFCHGMMCTPSAHGGYEPFSQAQAKALFDDAMEVMHKASKEAVNELTFETCKMEVAERLAGGHDPNKLALAKAAHGGTIIPKPSTRGKPTEMVCLASDPERVEETTARLVAEGAGYGPENQQKALRWREAEEKAKETHSARLDLEVAVAAAAKKKEIERAEAVASAMQRRREEAEAKAKEAKEEAKEKAKAEKRKQFMEMSLAELADLPDDRA